MEVGKIIAIFDISIEVILNENSNVKIGDILSVVDDDNYSFEVVTVNNVSATCISLASTRGLKKGTTVIKQSEGIQIEYSDNMLGRVFDSYGNVIDNKEFTSLNKRKIINVCKKYGKVQRHFHGFSVRLES